MAAHKKPIDVKALGAKYLANETLTIKDLAAQAGVHPHTLKRAFIAAKIKIRHYYPNGKGDAKAKSAEKKTTKASAKKTAKASAKASSKKVIKAKVAKAVKAIGASRVRGHGFIHL